LNLTLPWPPKQLSPNARVHWATLAKYKKQYRTACYYLAKEAKLSAPVEGKILLDITFYKPSRRRNDLDNCLASIKAGIDGLADCLNVDDSRFDYTIRMADDIGGMIKVKIYADP
jgi:crossover junction endodeoxyribonuclease RusA